MNQVTIQLADGSQKKYLLPDSRLAPLIDYLKAVKQEDFRGTWGPDEQTLFAGFSDQIAKDGT
ncbi:MAG: hypothetical protein V3U29_09645 [Phycisphaeraceae bacterium]